MFPLPLFADTLLIQDELHSFKGGNAMALKGRVAVVTGGAQGIGKAIARRLISEGMRVVIADIDEEAGEETVAEFACPGEITFLRADISKEEDVKRVAKETWRNYERAHLLINNAGVFLARPLTELSLEEWNRVISVNLTGAFLFTKHFTTYLRESRGSVINIASTRAFMSEANTEAYSASKGGIFALSHALAVSLGPTIRVNCISPGWIDVSKWKKKGTSQESKPTEPDHKQHPAGRVGKPEDIASIVAYLASDEASFITGANFTVDGGMTRKMIYL
jgi:NAD(P)-dependent dehydrogenase (short-subunit alcohol dehydrogenase family)